MYKQAHCEWNLLKICTILYSLKAWGLCPSSSQSLFVQKACGLGSKSKSPIFKYRTELLWASRFFIIWAGSYTGSDSDGKRGISHRRVVGNLTYRTVCTFWVTEEFWVLLTLLYWSFYRTDNLKPGCGPVVVAFRLGTWKSSFVERLPGFHAFALKPVQIPVCLCMK